MQSDQNSNASRPRLPIAGWCLAAGWLTAVLAGFAVVISLDMAPGEAGAAPRQRPMTVAPALDRPTLLLFAHPRCPCTKATFVELNRILTACPGAADVRVYFRTPENPSDEWTKTWLWEEAAALPDTTVFPDPGGALAAQCHVKTSGHVLLYSADGRLAFSGGITAARGEEGDNLGRSAIVAILKGQPVVEPESAVFGCPLFDPSDCESEKECPAP